MSVGTTTGVEVREVRAGVEVGSTSESEKVTPPVERVTDGAGAVALTPVLDVADEGGTPAVCLGML